MGGRAGGRAGLSLENLQKQSALSTLRGIVREEGAAALFRGIGPRVLWISVGGAIFLGAFDSAKAALENL